MLVRYYYHVAKTRALYESTDGTDKQPADNGPNSDGLEDFHLTVPKLSVGLCNQLDSQPGNRLDSSQTRTQSDGAKQFQTLDMYHHTDGIMRALAKRESQWKDDLKFTIKFVWQKLSNYHAEHTPLTSMLVISAHILDHFWKLPSVRKLNKRINIIPEDETFYITRYRKAILKHVEKEHGA